MSSKRVKRESIELVTPDHPNTPGEYERLRKEVNHKNEVFEPLYFFRLLMGEVITSLEDFVNKLQKGFCCGVCTELLYQPFNLACGHVFCYSVLISCGYD